VVPVVGALAAAILDRVELARLALELHAAEQALLLLVREPAQQPHRVLALDLEARVHEAVGELAVGGEDQQPAGVEVEPAHRPPAPAIHLGQLLEHGGPALGVVARDDLALGLVVHQHARQRLAEAQPDEVAVELHLVAGAHGIAELRDLAVDREVALGDQDLDVAARAVARLRHHLLQALALARAAAAVAAALAALAAALVRVLGRLGPFRHDSARPFQAMVVVWSVTHGLQAPWTPGVWARR